MIQHIRELAFLLAIHPGPNAQKNDPIILSLRECGDAIFSMWGATGLRQALVSCGLHSAGLPQQQLNIAWSHLPGWDCIQ